MFRVTFLGHQGWLLETDTTRVLVDPLLTDAFGHGGLLGRVFPPRRIDPAAFPPIDAVVLTHEHDDHFDIASLHRLDRGIRVLLSERSSIAARTALADMGFGVDPIVADGTTAIGDLRWHAFTADHREGESDEWDVLPFVVHDTEGHGAFMSSVDVRPTARMLQALGALAPPGVWAYANNLTSTTFQQIGPPTGATAQADAAALVRVVGRRHEAIARTWGTPLSTLVCGAGWSFPGERAVLDRHAFPIDADELCAGLRQMRPGARFTAAVPGRGVELERGRIAADIDGTPYLSAAPRSTWPPRAHAGDTLRLRDYAPACGRSELVGGEVDELLERLVDFARFLYGRPIHRAIQSLAVPDAKGRRPALGLALKTGDAAEILALAHDPRACSFVALEGVDPLEELASGLECWATDLLALLRGDIGPTALCHAGRLREWNAVPEHARFSAHELWTWAHPMRRPDAAVRLYRRLLANEPDTVPRVPAARRS